jgi:hypothetical protein
VSSRKEQKEALRREREQREQAAKGAQRRKRLVGYGIGGVIALAAIGTIIAVIVAGGGGGDGPGGSAPDAGELPDGGSVPEQKVGDLREAAAKAGCVTKDFAGTSREHSATGGRPPTPYTSEPPTSGAHDPVPAEDGAYKKAPSKTNLVHTLEHGRVIIWFKPSLPEESIASLKALFDEDQYQLVLAPNSEMKVDVAASAWNKDPEPNGTGRLLECPTYKPEIFDALRSFKDEQRGRGPEPVP